jgi:hypothetical protein
MSRKYGSSHDFDKVPSANIDRIGVERRPKAVSRQLKVSPGRTSSTNIGTIRPESQVNLEPCDRLKLERSILAEGTLSESLPNPRQVVAGSFLKDHTYE